MKHQLKKLGILVCLQLPVTMMIAQQAPVDSMAERGNKWLRATDGTTAVSEKETSVCSQTPAAGENQLTIGLQMLSHGEMRSGGLDASKEAESTVEENAYFLMERSRLSVDYKRSRLETKLVAQHSGIWGQKGQGSLNLYEAWAKMSTRSGLFAQVGRQALSYDDERIIGTNDWAMAALSHDVLRMGYEGHGHQAHVILAYNQNAENTYGGTYYSDGAQPYKTMHTLWYHYDLPKIPLGASLLFMNIGMQGGEKGGNGDNTPRTRYQQVAGVYLSYKPQSLKAEASYYRQMGRNEGNGKIDAWMASVKASYQFNRQWALTAGYDYLSGDDYLALRGNGQVGIPRHEMYKGFTSVYGSHHKFYGLMDFFYVKTYLDEFTPGLQNLYAGATYSLVKPLSFKFTYHYMATATKLDGCDMTLGHDIDIEASYQIMKEAKLSAGFSFMTGTETMQKLKLADNRNNLRWAWFSLVVSPSFFTSWW